MADDWQDALRERYPWAARTSFAVGEGWRTLVEETFAKLDAVIKALPPEEHGLEPLLQDVKEKYGTLRIDIVPCWDEIEAVIDEAEKRSERICDVCGSAQGRIREGGWISVRCDEHVSKSARTPSPYR